MKTKVFAGLLSLVALPLACSDKEPAPMPASRFESSREVTTVAIVESVDADKRIVTLKGPHGNTITVRADERIRNLSQIKPGDRVTITYSEAMAVQVVKKGEGQQDLAVITDQAATGEQPRGSVTRQVSLTAEVVSIDRANGSITLRGPEGEVQTVYVRHPERLSSVRVGDHLWIRYSEGLALAVDPAPTEAK
jgi:hypothetical protein